MVGGGATVGAGCAPDNSIKGGAPVMLSFGAVDPAAPSDGYGTPQYLPVDPTMPIPQRAQFLAMFDRILDPTTLEDAGGNAKAGIAALTSDVPDATLDPVTIYTPNGDSQFHVLIPQGPSITVLAACGMPSSANVTAALDPTKLRSHDQSTLATLAAGVVSTLAFATAPLAVATDLPDADSTSGVPALPVLAADVAVNLTFNTLTPGPMSGCQLATPLPSTATHIHVEGTLGLVPIVPLDVAVTQDPMDPTHWIVTPPGAADDGTGGSWPAGATITITIDAGATDNFNRPLGTASTASFMVMS
jgi:hypothetical protein